MKNLLVVTALILVAMIATVSCVASVVKTVGSNLEEPTYEYGNTEAIIDNSQSLHVYILYPSVDFHLINEEISAWANKMYNHARDELNEAQKKDQIGRAHV
jgi:hypothetical protein